MQPVVLCYHLVSPSWEHRLSIEPDLLLRQVGALRRFRSVRVTFDDGFRSAATVFAPLRDLGVPVELFVSSRYGADGAAFAIPELEGDDPAELATMTWDELRAHADDGIAIGGHTVSHPHLTTLSDEDLLHQLVDSKREIEDELGRPCPDFAYPYGEHDVRVRAAVFTAGYERAYALQDGSAGDQYALPRLDLYRRHSPARAALLATPFRRLVA